jgi:hypothetical protein
LQQPQTPPNKQQFFSFAFRAQLTIHAINEKIRKEKKIAKETRDNNFFRQAMPCSISVIIIYYELFCEFMM